MEMKYSIFALHVSAVFSLRTAKKIPSSREKNRQSEVVFGKLRGELCNVNEKVSFPFADVTFHANKISIEQAKS